MSRVKIPSIFNNNQYDAHQYYTGKNQSVDHLSGQHLSAPLQSLEPKIGLCRLQNSFADMTYTLRPSYSHKKLARLPFSTSYLTLHMADHIPAVPCVHKSGVIRDCIQSTFVAISPANIRFIHLRMHIIFSKYY